VQSARKIIDCLLAARWRRLAVVAGAALLAYLALPVNPLLLDAPLAVSSNQAVQSGPLHELFTKDFWGFPLDADYGTRSSIKAKQAADAASKESGSSDSGSSSSGGSTASPDGGSKEKKSNSKPAGSTSSPD